MRRIRNSIVVLSITALSVIIGACATGEPVDDNVNGIGQEQSPTLPEEAGVTLKPSEEPASKPADAGAKDATAAKDSSTQPPADSGPPPSTGDCDPNDPTLLLKLFMVQNPTTCPCSASECCFQAICLPL